MDIWLVLGCRPLFAANRVSHSKISISNPSYLSLTVSWLEVESKIYDVCFWTARNWGQHSFFDVPKMFVCRTKPKFREHFVFILFLSA